MAGFALPMRLPRLPRRIGRPRPALLAAPLVLALLAGAWLWFRDSSFASVQAVQIRGVSGPGAAQIEGALTRAARQMTTLDANAGTLRAAVAAYPEVRGIDVSTSFPHGMRITVSEQPPVAVLQAASGARSAVAANGVLLGDRVVDLGAARDPDRVASAQAGPRRHGASVPRGARRRTRPARAPGDPCVRGAEGPLGGSATRGCSSTSATPRARTPSGSPSRACSWRATTRARPTWTCGSLNAPRSPAGRPPKEPARARVRAAPRPRRARSPAAPRWPSGCRRRSVAKPAAQASLPSASAPQGATGESGSGEAQSGSGASSAAGAEQSSEGASGGASGGAGHG